MATASHYAHLRMTAALLLSIGAPGFVGAPAHAQAKSAVALESVIEVERTVKTADVETKTYGSPAKGTVIPGDNLRFSIQYANTSDEPASALSVTNPIPTAVEFIRVEEDWAQVSVDGGNSFGALADLSVTSMNAQGVSETRAANPADVTHIRWKLDRPLAPKEKGSLRFYGRVK